MANTTLSQIRARGLQPVNLPEPQLPPEIMKLLAPESETGPMAEYGPTTQPSTEPSKFRYEDTGFPALRPEERLRLGKGIPLKGISRKARQAELTDKLKAALAKKKE